MICAKKNIYVLVMLLFASCVTTYEPAGTPEGKLLDYATARPDSALSQMLGPYKQQYAQTMNQVVGYAGEDMEKAYPEGKLGNFAADILLAYGMGQSENISQNTFSLLNNGGLRVPLQKGAVTRGKVFELMPFENLVCAVELKGKYLVDGLANYLMGKKGQPVSANVKLVFTGEKVKTFLVNNVPVDTAATYTIITSDYLATGGDNMAFFKSGTIVKTFGEKKLRDVIIEHFERNTTQNKPALAGELTGRIIFE